MKDTVKELFIHLELRYGLVPRPKIDQTVAKAVLFTYQKID